MNPQEEIWSGPKGDKYVKRFFWTPEQVDAHWLKHYSVVSRTQLVSEAIAEAIPRAASVLEIGCSCGNQLEILKGMGFQNLAGTDINASAIGAIKSRRPYIKAQVASSDKLPFADKSFDMVMTCWTLCHMSNGNYAKAIKEIQRIARCWIFASEPYSQGECELQPGYLWSRPVAADIGWKLLHHQFAQAVGGKWSTGIFLFERPAQ